MIGRRGLLSGLLASASAAGAQSFRVGRSPGFRAGFQFLGGGALNSILQEDGTAILQEDGTEILLEN